MKRNLKKLESTDFDVLVIGGGIQGSAIALKSAKIGYKTALIEKNDFLGATSSNSLKIIHGGLRYLQQFDLKRMRESIQSRKFMIGMDPENVTPLGFLMPLYGFGLAGKEALKIALTINDFISYDRNINLNKKNHIPNGRIISLKECRQYAPAIGDNQLRGAAVWYDAIAMNTENLGMKFIKKAAGYGAEAANYLKVINIHKKDSKIESVEVQDGLTNKKFSIRTKCLINSAGPWIGNIQDITGSSFEPFNKNGGWAQGINLVIKKLIFPKYAVCLQGRDKYLIHGYSQKKSRRAYFFVPWMDRTMIGTFYKSYAGSPDDFHISKDDIMEFLDQINEIYPPGKINFSDICFYHAGLLPVEANANGRRYVLKKKTDVFKHENPYGLISIKTIKYTSAPVIADRVIKHIIEIVGEKTLPSRRLENKPVNVAESKMDYRSTMAEIKRYIQDEMALKLSDVVFRRNGFGNRGCPPLTVLLKIAQEMGRLLNWSDKIIESEINSVLERYKPLNIPIQSYGDVQNDHP